MNTRNSFYLNSFLKELSSFQQIGSLAAANKITKINLCRLKILNTTTIKIILKADSQPFPHIRLSWITMPILTKIMSQINKLIQIWIIFAICNQAHQISLKKQSTIIMSTKWLETEKFIALWKNSKWKIRLIK